MLDRLKILVLLQLKNKSKRFDRMSKHMYASIAVQAVIFSCCECDYDIGTPCYQEYFLYPCE